MTDEDPRLVGRPPLALHVVRQGSFKECFQVLPEVHDEEHDAAFAKWVIENEIMGDGHWHQKGGEGVPVFSDGTCQTFGWRSWGGRLAEIYREFLGDDCPKYLLGQYDYVALAYDGKGTAEFLLPLVQAKKGKQ